MRRPERLLAALWPIALAGCASQALELAPSRSDRPWVAATGPGGEIVPGKSASTPPAGGTTYVLPSNPALGVVPPGPQIDADHAYTLAELIDIAQSGHPQTRIAWALARNAALAAGIAEGAYLPRVTANVVGGYQTSRGQSSAFGGSVGSDGSGSGTVSALSLQWLLFDFGERSALVEAARQVSVVSNIAFTAAHQRVIHEVCLAFYAHAAAGSRVETADRSLKNAKDVEAAAEDRYRRGIGTVIEVAQARQASAQARLAQVQARGAADDAYAGLLAAMGVSPLSRIKIAEVSKRALSPALLDPVDRLVSEALARRPDVLGAYAAQQASAANIRAAEADFRPKVFLSATGAYNTGQLGVTAIPPIGQQTPTFNVSGNRWGSTVMLGVTIPLYDGNTRDAALKQAYATADKAAATLELTRDDAARQVVVARNAMQTSLAAYEASTALQSAARVTFDAALDAFRHGVGSITDVTVAETQLLQATNASTDAYSNALSAAVTLAFATGSLGSAPQP